jgi:hypothetical protein
VTDDQGWRTDVTRRTAVYAAFLGGLPRWIPLAAVVALTLGGLLADGIPGAVLLTAVAAAAGWLAMLRWDSLNPAGRLVRVLVIAVVLAVAAGKLRG